VENVINFVTDNYLWFVIGGVVIVMAIIGYFADKKGFGKPKKEEVAKTDAAEIPAKKEEPVVTEVQNIEPVKNDETLETATIDAPEVVLNDTPVSDVEVNNNTSVDNISDINEVVDPVVYDQPVAETFPEVNPVVEPTPFTSDVNEVSPIETNDSTVDTNDNVVVNNSTTDENNTSDEENIWKF
jgi:hypothetical protein